MERRKEEGKKEGRGARGKYCFLERNIDYNDHEGSKRQNKKKAYNG